MSKLSNPLSDQQALEISKMQDDQRREFNYKKVLSKTIANLLESTRNLTNSNSSLRLISGDFKECIINPSWQEVLCFLEEENGIPSPSTVLGALAEMKESISKLESFIEEASK